MTSNYTNLDTLLNQNFAGKVVRKDLTKKIKEGANVPVYVLEYLLGGNCTSRKEETPPERARPEDRLNLNKITRASAGIIISGDDYPSTIGPCVDSPIEAWHK